MLGVKRLAQPALRLLEVAARLMITSYKRGSYKQHKQQQRCPISLPVPKPKLQQASTICTAHLLLRCNALRVKKNLQRCSKAVYSSVLSSAERNSSNANMGYAACHVHALPDTGCLLARSRQP
jgi:hypothetical protein